MQPIDEVLFIGQTAATTKALSEPKLAAFRHLRVYAEWATGVTSGIVTVRVRARAGRPAVDAGTLNATGLGGKANSLRVEGPVIQVEAEITTVVAGGADPKVTVGYIAGGE